MKTRRITLALSAAFAALFLSLFAAGDRIPVAALNDDVFITIDSGELRELGKTEGLGTLSGRMEILSEANGVAVVRIGESDIEALSGAMHKHHHKCAGFIWHPTEEDALRSALRADPFGSPSRLVDYTIDNQTNVAPLLPMVQELPIRQMILDLSSYDTRRHDSETGQQSAAYINFKWTAMTNGRDDISVSTYGHPGNVTPQPSVVMTIEGTESPDEYVILGGHQDSINRNGSALLAPGADDNASGIASLTEAIRVIVESGFRPKKTVQFMAYAAEEVGLRGSRNIAQAYLDNNTNVIGVLQLDMTNYTEDPNTDFALITDWTNADQNQFIRDLVAAYLPDHTIVNAQCGYACSDHAAWHERNFAASFPHEATFAANNDSIHTINDTISLSNNNAEHALKYSKLALAYIGELAKGSAEAAPSGRAVFDFDGDAKTDVSVFRANASGIQGPEGSGSQWWLMRSSDQGTRGLAFGSPDDVPASADFTGDGKADVAFFRPSSGEWYVLRSEDDSFFAFPFGSPGDVPAPGDFDGDGKADPAVFRPSSATWFILRSSDSGLTVVPFGVNGDKPTVADFDGDGSDDVAIYRPSVNQFWQLRSTDGAIGYQFGSAGDRTAVGDWTGDGKADVAFYRPSTSEWFVIRSEDSSFYAFPWGASGDVPSPGDYDGDGMTDPAVWRPSDRTWYIFGSTSGFSAVLFGADGDLPLPSSASVD
ncbi:MAG: M20/M25/M40 family metallo-hydrolase [Acidobacteriota bacterium]|nr:MAG: M20/M25/M40 family metallo-hydrolase [Acidobacteriota bacterium]